MQQHEGNGGNGNGRPIRDAKGRWLPGVSGNAGGPPRSPLGVLLRVVTEELARPEALERIRADLREWIQADPRGALLALIDRTPNAVRTALMSRILDAEERAGLVRQFEVRGGDEIDRARELVYEALTRAAQDPPAGDAGRR